jgi:hypothetical protein
MTHKDKNRYRGENHKWSQGIGQSGICKIQLVDKEVNGGVSRTPSELHWSVWSSNELIEAWTLNVCFLDWVWIENLIITGQVL